MKIRSGFVSNSSTQSFVCEVCGESSEEEYSFCEDTLFRRCTNGHIFCGEHTIGKGIELGDYDGKLFDSPYFNVPPEKCPICTMKVFRDSDLLKIIFKHAGLDRKTFERQLREKYKNWGSLAYNFEL